MVILLGSRRNHRPWVGGFSECPKIDDDFERLVCEINSLKVAGDTVASVESQIMKRAHHWTVLKLVFLKMYVRDVYTPIIARRYDFMAFIDLFAGTGLNAYKDAKFYVPGSTLVAWFFATYPFDKIYAVGYEQNDYRVLKKRLEAFIPRRYLWLKRGDANVLVNEIANDLIKIKDSGVGVHYLAFIDPDCTEAHWRTIEKLVSLEQEGIYGDFIILLQARLIARIIGRIRKGLDKTASDKLDLFFGTSEWRELMRLELGKLEEGILKFYIERLEKLKSRALVRIVSIELMRSDIHYYLIYITRETRRGSPYLRTVEWLKNFVERVDKQKVVDSAIRKALGMPLLPDFLKGEFKQRS